MKKVSVIIPVHNRVDFAARTIESVLCQTYPNIEIIVVDDGSAEEVRKRLVLFGDKIRYVYQQKAGACSARNLGMRLATGDYFALLDSDDLYTPEKISRSIEYLEKHPECGFVHTPVFFIDNNDHMVYPHLIPRSRGAGWIARRLLESNFVCNSTIVFTRSCFERVGFYDESVILPNDWDMWLRMAEQFPAGYINDPLTGYRFLGSSIMADLARCEREELYVLHKAFARNKGLSMLAKNKILSYMYERLAKMLGAKGDMGNARKRFLKAFLKNPFNIKAGIFLLSCVIFPKHLQAWLEKKVIWRPEKMVNTIRIALVCTSLNQIGGKNVHFKNMYVKLNNTKFALTIVLCSSMGREHRAYLLQEGVRKEDIIFIPRFKKWLVVPFIVELCKIIETRKINIVHTFQIQSDIFGFLALRLAGSACLISQQESKAIEESLPVFKKLFYRLFNICIRDFIKKTVVVSQGLKNELIAERLRPKQKIEVIPLGVAVPEEYKKCNFCFPGLQSKRPLIGTIARLNKEKGINRFINAMPFILEKMPLARFLIVGKGDEKANLEAQVRSLNLVSKVDFQEVPWSDSIYKVLSSLDIFVMPSLREGCPTALLEALAFARPVVASKIDGISDLIEDGRNGLMVDTSDPKAFAQKIVFLCENPGTAIAMGNDGREKILSRFTLEYEMDRFRKLYQEALTDIH